MRLFTIFAVLILLLFSCYKEPKRILPDPPKYIDTVRPAITISENVVGCKLIRVGALEQEVDSLIGDTLFTLYKILPTDPNYQSITLYFTTNLPAYRILSANWQIGAETTSRNGNRIAVDFETPAPSLTARLIINWRYTYELVSSFTDTLYKNFTLSADTSLFGKYYGANTDDPLNKYTVTIGSMIDSTYGDPIKIWGIQNLMIGYPFKLEIQQKSKAFGICSAIGPKYIIQIGASKYSFPFSFGYLNAKKDSITIDYSYYRVNPITSFYDTFFVKKFIGIKL
jgi:hypothetical protein